ncbi:hypothetical protein E2C01_057313 [Portunus trituberculatus]|uniref:Uncharacterized protein n=1 Tax=Portunus trituberculatus TaxID=210409 RepID=A0A5B7GZZ8_PORTR|nr:hypothetical protein [Portunus trituberculatus]
MDNGTTEIAKTAVYKVQQLLDSIAERVDSMKYDNESNTADAVHQERYDNFTKSKNVVEYNTRDGFTHMAYSFNKE